MGYQGSPSGDTEQSCARSGPLEGPPWWRPTRRFQKNLPVERRGAGGLLWTPMPLPPPP